MKIIVIGAGLAGAACAHALAQQGCTVAVLEASQSAGLPVALMAPHHGAAHNPIHQLSLLGQSATLLAAQTLLVRGCDWQLCGSLLRAGKLSPDAQWMPQAAWIRPAALVAAWLAHPRVALHCGAAVHQLQLLAGATPRWNALDANGTVLAQADAVVLANASQAAALLSRFAQPSANPADKSFQAALQSIAGALHPVAGEVIYGPWNEDWRALWPALLPELAQTKLPAAPRFANAGQSDVENGAQAAAIEIEHPKTTDFCAVNGNGHFIPDVPWDGIWDAPQDVLSNAPSGGHEVQAGPVNAESLNESSDGEPSTAQRIWLSGSTYTHHRLDTQGSQNTKAPHDTQSAHLPHSSCMPTPQGMAANLARLQQLLPAAAPLLAAQQRAGQLRAWAGTRCTTRDRLPAVGAISPAQAPGLYACTAMGSRGLSFTAICGQHLAAHITGVQQALLPAGLAQAVDPERFTGEHVRG